MTCGESRQALHIRVHELVYARHVADPELFGGREPFGSEPVESLMVERLMAELLMG